MMYTAFPQRGGLVERCHAAAENTHSALGLFMKDINRTLAPRLSQKHTKKVIILKKKNQMKPCVSQITGFEEP